MASLRALSLFALLALEGCGTMAGMQAGTAAAGIGTGYLESTLSAAQSGGSLTPFSNLGDALALQEFANAHNTNYCAQQIINAQGLVTVMGSPCIVSAWPPQSPSPMPAPYPAPSPSPFPPNPAPVPAPEPTPVPVPMPSPGPPSFPPGPVITPP